MQNKIDIPGTTISLEIIDKVITVTNKIKYDIQMQFKNQDAEPSLDESGDIFSLGAVALGVGNIASKSAGLAQAGNAMKTLDKLRRI